MSKYNICDITDVFNKNIKKLLLIVNESLEDNILFDTIKRRTLLIIKSHPIFLLEEAGPQLFKYRDHIKNDSEDFILNIEENVMNDNQMQDYIKNNENDKDGIMILLNMLKEVWVKYDEKEKKIIKKTLKILLSEYCKYLTIKN
jgi:dTDP-glucose pyrophosphorylase